MKKTATYYQRQKEFHVFVADTFHDLVQLKKAGDKASFNQSLLKILPEVRKYVSLRLNRAIKRGHFPKGKYKADDFIDQLFIEVYENIENVENEKNLHSWLFKKTDELVGDIIAEEGFDSAFLENIDNYSRQEWDRMEEKFSAEADGDLVMREELDDVSYPKKTYYVLQDVFIQDNENSLIEKINEDLENDRIQNRINMVLHNLPLPMQTVFELFVQQHFEIEEIAKIRNSTVEEVEELLKSARTYLRKSFYKDV